MFKSKDKRFIIHGSIVVHDVEYIVYDDADAITAGNKVNPVVTYLSVDDVAAARAKALENGFKPAVCYFNRGTGIEDQFWGDSCCSMKDPYGHIWTFAKSHGKDEKSDAMVAGEKLWSSMYDLP